MVTFANRNLLYILQKRAFFPSSLYKDARSVKWNWVNFKHSFFNDSVVSLGYQLLLDLLDWWSFLRNEAVLIRFAQLVSELNSQIISLLVDGCSYILVL